MANSSQAQKAGDNATQMQVGTLVYNAGITEERAREIYREQFQISKESYTKEAAQIADARAEELENAMIPRLKKIDDQFRFLADPAFQFLLRDAQRVAASTDKKEDYDLLSELLARHIQSRDDRARKAGITRAIKIVDEVDNSALCGLTILFFMTNCYANGINISEILLTFNRILAALVHADLPEGDSWIYHLDLLNAVIVQQFNASPKLFDIFSFRYDGILCVGIKENSDEHQKALDILSECGIDRAMLVPNELLDGYMRLRFVKKSDIDTTVFLRNNIPRIDNKPCADACKRVWNLYSQDNRLKNMLMDNFHRRCDGFDTLKKIRSWLDKIPNYPKITEVGYALARSNAMRCCPNLKTLFEK